MSSLPLALEWTSHGFALTTPSTQPKLLVADSWRVRNGRMWGLPDHIDRFLRGVVAQGLDLDTLNIFDGGHLTAAVEDTLGDIAQEHVGTDLFPRLSVEIHDGSPRIVLLVRPAPQVRTTTSLSIPDYTDPRIRPTVKGPDIDLMRRLVAEAATDDVVLHDGTNVIETTTGALLMWQTPQELVFCQATQQLASISAQRIVHHARSHHIAVTSRPVTIQQVLTGEYPVWCTNTLHGISPVTAISGPHGEIHVASHPDTTLWQRAWWQRFPGEPQRQKPTR